MKKIALILALIYYSIGTAQTKQDLIMQFIDEHIGEKVGNGVCSTLVSEAYKFAGFEDPYNRKNRHSSCYCKYGDEIPRDSVVSGDIFYVVYTDSLTNKFINAHIGFVYGVSDSNISIANQNYGVNKLKHSKVEIVVWSDMVEKQLGVEQKIYFFHKNG